METWIGHSEPEHQFFESVTNGRIHHAWLLTGPEGIGKASFARRAATWLLAHKADGAAHSVSTPQFDDTDRNESAALIEAGTHPDFHRLTRAKKERSEELARSISVAQVRNLLHSLTGTPGIAEYRAVIIDTVDDLERSGANALLKTLEEPFDKTVFFLISHAPAKLLPTLRSRCRQLRFSPLGPAQMSAWLNDKGPALTAADQAVIEMMAHGAPGRALTLLDAEVGALADVVRTIIKGGDPDNARRTRLSRDLSNKAARPRFEAFLELAPLLAARHVQQLSGNARMVGLVQWKKLRTIAEHADSQSYDIAMTVFEMGTLLARLGR